MDALSRTPDSETPRSRRPRLPVLRRPPGWTVLDERALRVRAAQLFHACASQEPMVSNRPTDRPEPGPGPRVEHPAAGAPRRAAGGADAGEPVPSAAFAQSRGASEASEVSGVSGVSRVSGRTPRPSRVPGFPWRTLPWALLPMVLVLLGPWPVWAPLAAGLGLGILLLRSGSLAPWLDRRARANAHAQDHAHGDDSGFDGTQPAAGTLRTEPGRIGPLGLGNADSAVDAVRPVRPPRLPIAHPGWLLTAALVLVGVQAAMLFATVHVSRQATTPRTGKPERIRDAEDPRTGSRAAEAAEDAILAPLPMPRPPASAPRDPSPDPTSAQGAVEARETGR